MPTDPESPSEELDRVADTVARLRAGVRQRQAERATGPAAAGATTKLLELREHEYLEEPPCFSPRPVLGSLLVLARKAVARLFLRWYLHPLMGQQNRFNQVTGHLLEELIDTLEQLQRQLDGLAARVGALEERDRE